MVIREDLNWQGSELARDDVNWQGSELAKDNLNWQWRIWIDKGAKVSWQERIWTGKAVYGMASEDLNCQGRIWIGRGESWWVREDFEGGRQGRHLEGKEGIWYCAYADFVMQFCPVVFRFGSRSLCRLGGGGASLGSMRLKASSAASVSSFRSRSALELCVC